MHAARTGWEDTAENNPLKTRLGMTRVFANNGTFDYIHHNTTRFPKTTRKSFITRAEILLISHDLEETDCTDFALRRQ
jgi:hypothetical protein